VCWLPGQAGARVPHCTGKHPPQGTSTGATRVNCRAIGMCIVSGRQARRMRGSHRSPPDATGGATQMRSHAGGSHAGSHAKTSRTTAHCPPTPHRTIRPTATLPHIATHCSDTLLRPCGHSTRHTEPAAPLDHSTAPHTLPLTFTAMPNRHTDHTCLDVPTKSHCTAPAPPGGKT